MYSASVRAIQMSRLQCQYQIPNDSIILESRAELQVQNQYYPKKDSPPIWSNQETTKNF